MTIATAVCSFCGRKPDEVPHLVVADRGTAICLACARRCIGICEAAEATPVARFPRPVAEVARLAPNTRHLDAFLHYARLGSGGTPPPVLPWVCEFLEVYETDVLTAARDAATWSDSLIRSNGILRAFDALMAPYRGDRRRAYLGAVFDRLLGRSIREGFTYHVDMTVLVERMEEVT